MTSTHRFLRFYQEGWQGLWNPQQEPNHNCSYYIRNQIKSMVLWTNSEERSLPYRALWHTFVVILQSATFSSMCYALKESLGDIVELGRDLAIVIAAFFIWFKVIYFLWYADDLDDVIDDLDACRHWLREGPGSTDARSTKRWHYTVMYLMLITWTFFMGLFVILLNTAPLWVADQDLPLHTIYPFEWHSKAQHPVAHAFSYLIQVLALSYCLLYLLFMEGLSTSIYWEITCSIKVLCIELRHLSETCRSDVKLLRSEVNRLIGLHQHILGILDRTNKVFHGTLKMQVIVNFFLVSLSVFEALMARKDPKVMLQFGILMLLTLGHLSMWSKFGDIISQESLDIAHAAYGAYDPLLGCKEVHRDLCLIIMHAQDPMQMQASPFPPFNLINYAAILNQCYSILTLLLNTLE